MPEGEAAGGRVGRKVRAQPGLLWRALGATDGAAVVARVQRDEVPGPDVEAVVALVAIPGPAREDIDSVEVVEVALCPAREVLVIAGGREGDRLHTTPAELVGLREARVAPRRVLRVTEHQHTAQAPADEQVRGVLLAAFRARRAAAGSAGNVARGRDHGISSG